MSGLSNASTSKLETFLVLHPLMSLRLKKMQTSARSNTSVSVQRAFFLIILPSEYEGEERPPGLTWQILHTRAQQRSPEIVRRVAGILAQRDLSSGEDDRFR